MPLKNRRWKISSDGFYFRETFRETFYKTSWKLEPTKLPIKIALYKTSSI
jgi:hypothetical protein